MTKDYAIGGGVTKPLIRNIMDHHAEYKTSDVLNPNYEVYDVIMCECGAKFNTNEEYQIHKNACLSEICPGTNMTFAEVSLNDWDSYTKYFNHSTTASGLATRGGNKFITETVCIKKCFCGAG